MEKSDNQIEEKTKKELGQKYLELQLIDRQIKQVQAQAQALEAQVMELASVSAALEEIGNVKAGTEILVPVANGIFAKAEIKENKNFLVSVGGSAAVEKTVADTKEMLQIQSSEIRKMQQELAKQIEKLAVEAQKAEQAMTSLLMVKSEN